MIQADEAKANELDGALSQQSTARTPSNVMQRIGNLMASRSNVNIFPWAGNIFCERYWSVCANNFWIFLWIQNNLSSYKDTELHQFWMPDNKSKECYDCSQKFSTFRRKHHCRLCGQIFCSKCCSQVVPGKIIKCSGKSVGHLFLLWLKKINILNFPIFYLFMIFHVIRWLKSVHVLLENRLDPSENTGHELWIRLASPTKRLGQ